MQHVVAQSVTTAYTHHAIIRFVQIGCLDSSMCCCQLPAELTWLCRYDKSLWPANDVAADQNLIPSSASRVKGLQISPETPALGKDSVKHLRQRMATVLDVELCNTA